MIIGTAGHIDHGKTALVKALTGVDTDRLPEEKRRGITVELGFAPIDLGGIAASVIDVPGHEAFVKAMVAGAAGVDVALLVIAGDEGIMPQTRDHLAILDLLEIPSLVVALTKSDVVDAEWLSLVRDEVASLLAGSRWRSAPIIPCSAVNHSGLDELRDALRAAVPASERGSAEDIFRLPVDRCFTLKGTGTVVTGTVWSGNLASESTVTILPAGRTARVRRLHRHGSGVESIGPGDRAAIALSGIEVSDIERGFTLVTSANWEATSVLDTRVVLLDAEQVHIGARSSVRLHLAGADVGATLIFAEDGRFARIKLDAPIAARGGDRFVLRLPAPVGTIGGGIVLDPHPRRNSVGSAARSFESADPRDASARFLCLLDASADRGLAIESLPVRVGVAPELVPAMLRGASCAVAGERCFSSAALAATRDLVLAALRKAETTFPLERGVQLESVSHSVGADHQLVRLAIAGLEVSGAVEVAGSVVRRAGWIPRLSPADAATVSLLVHAICFGGSEPPSAGELGEKYGGAVPGLLRYLEREGRVVQVGADRFYARNAVDELIEKLRKNLEMGAEYGPSQLRDLLGFSRKYLIPFLEYCDRAGVTERKGEFRSLMRVRESLTQM